MTDRIILSFFLSLLLFRPSIEEVKSWAESFDKLMLSPRKSMLSGLQMSLLSSSTQVVDIIFVISFDLNIVKRISYSGCHVNL